MNRPHALERAIRPKLSLSFRSLNISMRLTTTSVALLIGIAGFADAAERCELVKDIDFNNRTGSYRTYTQAMATSDFGTLEKNAAGDVRGLDRPGTTWLARNAVGNGVLRANYPANIAGGVNTGILFDQKFAPTEEAVMEYRIKFDNNFKWAAGGKLPGLAGSEGQIPVGCTQDVNRIKNGFSARLMWRKNGDLVAYTYLPNRLEPHPGNCGIDYKFAQVDTDQWYTIRQYIKLNTPGQKNGILRMEIDGQVGLEMRDVEYRLAGKDSVKINDFIFHTYRGGGATDVRFHSPNNDYIYMDDFKVWTNCENPDDNGSSTPAVGPAGYTFAAREGQNVNVEGTMNIAYGANDSFNYHYDQTSDLQCSNSVFGDPIPGVVKNCFVKSVAVVDKPSEDQVCTIAVTGTWDNARAKFAEDCSAFTRNSCQSVNVGGTNWVMCSSLPNATNYLPVVNGSQVATIQAEDYSRAVDSSVGNNGNAYRAGDVDIDTTNDGGAGYVVGWVASGEKLTFDVLVTKAGPYSMSMRTSSPNSTGKYNVLVNGQIKASNKETPNTGSWSAFQTRTFDIGNLAVGSQEITLDIVSSSFNINWFKLFEQNTGTGPVIPAACLQYSGNGKQELNLSTTTCVELPANLNGKTLSVWDSDSNGSCDFRGSVSSVNGNGSLAITSNYVTTATMSGTKIRFDANNGCKYVQMRVY